MQADYNQLTKHPAVKAISISLPPHDPLTSYKMRRNQNLLGQRLLVVTAHPDDESYGCAGTLALHAKSGVSVHLLCATAGENGQSHLPQPLKPAVIKKRRTRELRAAAKVLDIRSIRLLSIPDGTVAQHVNSLVLAVRAAVRKHQPDCIVSFGPCGITGHRDHIAAGVAARRVARQYKLPFAAMTLSIRLQHLARKFLISRRRSPHYTQNFSFLNPNTSFAINQRIKRQAIRCHASQMDGPKAFTGFPNYVVEGLLRREYFNVWKI